MVNTHWLLVWNHGILLSIHIRDLILPIDFHSIIFQDGGPPVSYACITMLKC